METEATKCKLQYGRPRCPNELGTLYDIQSDPEELVDLSSTRKDITAESLSELKSKIVQVNRPYL